MISASYIRIILTEFIINIPFAPDLDQKHKIAQTFSLHFSAKIFIELALFFEDPSFTSTLEWNWSKESPFSSQIEDCSKKFHQWQLKIWARSCKLNSQFFIHSIIYELSVIPQNLPINISRHFSGHSDSFLWHWS